MLETVLAYIEQNNQYLLLFRNKKEIDVNKGKWIGVGGHIEKDETPEDALIREIKEETNLDVLSYFKKGIVYFVYKNITEKMHLYVVDKCSGELGECDEGELKFIKIKDLLSLNMWDGDKFFLDLMLKKEPYFEMELVYNNDTLISVKRIK